MENYQFYLLIYFIFQVSVYWVFRKTNLGEENRDVFIPNTEIKVTNLIPILIGIGFYFLFYLFFLAD